MAACRRCNSSSSGCNRCKFCLSLTQGIAPSLSTATVTGGLSRIVCGAGAIPSSRKSVAVGGPPVATRKAARCELDVVCDTLDTLGLPALIVDGNRRVRKCSAKLHPFLARRGFELIRDEAAVRTKAPGSKVPIRPSAPGLTEADAHRPGVISVSTCTVIEMHPLGEMNDGAVADAAIAVFKSTDVTRRARVLITDFDLTETELEVALALYRGQRRKQIAKERGVSEETVKSQIKSIYAKLNCRRESGLIRKIVSLIHA